MIGQKISKKVIAVTFLAFIITSSLLTLGFLFIENSTSIEDPPNFSLSGSGLIIEEQTESLTLKCYKPDVNSLLRFFGFARIRLIIKNAPHLDLFLNNKKIQISRSNIQYKGIITVKNNSQLKIKTAINVDDSDYSFGILGDTQGNSDMLQSIIESVNDKKLDFLLHCGDITPSGTLKQFTEYQAQIESLTIPVYHVPGNHDIKYKSSNYETTIGPLNYSFLWKQDLYIMLNTAEATISQQQIDWFVHKATTQQYKNLFITMHVPPLDPRIGETHGFINETNANLLMEKIKLIKPSLVFNGHIHMFNVTQHFDTTWITTGGGGAALYEKESHGGFYHYLVIDVDDQLISYDIIPVESQSSTYKLQLINGNLTRQLSIFDLKQLENVSDFVTFQNIYGNWPYYGNYSGIPLTVLVELMGGMEKNQTLRVVASDGYAQDFCYYNIYPNQTWYQKQGIMILALQYNSTYFLDWVEGPRIIFLAPDGKYSNEDCELTSCVDQGYHNYGSAGARLVKYTEKIMVI